MAEKVTCAPAGGELFFWWSWCEPITSVAEMDEAGRRIAHVLTPLGDG